MNCGLCKLPIRGNEQFVTDHYKCSAELTQSLIAERDAAVSALKVLTGMYGPSTDYDHKAREAWALAEAAIAKVEAG